MNSSQGATLIRRELDLTGADQPRAVRFGLFEVDVRAGELRKNGVKIKLQDQPLQVLVTLLQHAGDVVTREELRRELWPTDTFVDFETGLNTAVKKLRDALGDSADNPIFVETLARRGYRFKAPVEKPAVPPPTVPLPSAIQPPSATPASRRPYLLVAGVALAVLLLAAAWNWAGHRRQTGGDAAIESLAVLPLENLSRDPEQEYFSEGMTDELTTQLSKIGAVRVVSRTSAMRYKGTNKSLPEIARELNVDGVIEGSVMRSGQRVRITVQLIQGRTDQYRWTETYERDLGDVLKLQGDVAQAVAQQIRIQITPAQQARLRSAPAVDPEAYEDYLKGRYNELRSTQASIKEAQAYFEKAVQKDPGFALAYVGIADCYLELGAYRWLPPQDAYQHGSEAINHALQLDETLGEAHSTLGFLYWRYAWDWQAAERELRYAVELNPSYVGGHESLVWYLAWNGRHDEAVSEVEKIRQLDPVYPLLDLEQAGVYYHQRDYKSLVAVGQKAVATDPNVWMGHYFLAVGFEGSGQSAQAVPEYQQAIELSQRNSDAVAGLGHVYASMGKTAEAEKILEELQQQSQAAYVSPYMIAVIYSGLDRKDKAFEFLEKAYREKSFDLVYFVKADLRVDGLRSDTRFLDITRRMALPQ